MNSRSFGFEAIQIFDTRGVRPVVGIVRSWNLRVAAGMTDVTPAKLSGAILLANGSTEVGRSEDPSRQSLKEQCEITLIDRLAAQIGKWSVMANFPKAAVTALVGDNSMLWMRDEFWKDANQQDAKVQFIVEKSFQQNFPTCNGMNITHLKRLSR